jgi:hypothetical protein
MLAPLGRRVDPARASPRQPAPALWPPHPARVNALDLNAVQYDATRHSIAAPYMHVMCAHPSSRGQF